MIIGEAASFSELLTVGGGGIVGGGTLLTILLWSLRKLFERQEKALDKNTNAIETLSTDLSAHKNTTLVSIGAITEAQTTLAARVDAGFENVNRRLDDGSKRHEEFRESITDLKGEVSELKGST